MEQETHEESEQGPTLETTQASKPEETVEYWVRVTLEQMYRHHPKRYVRERAQMILLRDKGYAVSRIADILGVQSRTVRQVIAAYDRKKLMGLYRKPGSGRLSRLGTEQWQQFKEWVSKGPKSVGYRCVKWTTRSLRWYIEKRFNVTFSREWILQQLHRCMGQSWTRGQLVYAFRKDLAWQAERQRFCVRLLALLEQAHKGEIMLLFEDESIFTLFGEVGYSWSPVGTTQEVRSAGKRGRVVVFGAAAPQSGQTHYRIEDENINQESTLRFVTQVVRYYQTHAPGTPLVIVLDTHPGHTSQLVEDVVKEHEHVTLVNTPTQSPDLNPIEHVWDWLGEQMMKNDFFDTKDALKQAIRHFLCSIAGIKEQVLSWLGDLQTLYAVEAEIVAGI